MIKWGYVSILYSSELAMLLARSSLSLIGYEMTRVWVPPCAFTGRDDAILASSLDIDNTRAMGIPPIRSFRFAIRDK